MSPLWQRQGGRRVWWRQKKLGQLSQEDLAQLVSEVERWQAEVEHQEAAFDEEWASGYP